jgi:diguanylate cyclase (GGDEF)-like protein
MLGVADRLAENLRRIDTLGHFGEGEFAVCLPRIGPVDAAAVAARLLRAVATAPVETPVGPLSVTMDVGLVAAPAVAAGSEAERAAALLSAADQALVEARKTGRQQVPATAG